MSKPKSETKTHLNYAGFSERRILCLKEIPGVDLVKAVGGGEEPDIREVDVVTNLKLDYARGKLGAHTDSSVKSLLIAADARTEVSAESAGSSFYVSKGKPKSEKEVLSNFEMMLAIAQKFGYATYRVVSASALENGVRMGSETIQAAVVISRENLEYLVSLEGFIAYLRAFKLFYSTPPYSSKGLSAINVKKLSGGISLPVLVSMGLVEQVDGVSLRNNDQDEVYDALRGGLLTVACGFGPNILNKIHPNAMDRILAWDWLNQVTTKMINAYNNISMV